MKTKIIFLIISALILFTGSSPWEGAAAVAPAGELPVSGFFVATNSFPRNTVVDITNIETGKSTRAIVGNTLNSPGLLAVVSREAAELIGMRPGSISRVRMVQPSDPIAYLRFTESLAQGIPGYDSGQVINEETLLAEVYGADTYEPPVSQPVEPVPPAVSSFTGPSYLMEPEWGGRERLSIVDMPGYNIDPHVPVHVAEEHNDPFLFTEQEPQRVAEEPPVTPPVTPPVYVTERHEYTERHIEREFSDEIIKDVSPRFEERAPLEIVKDVSEFRTEMAQDSTDKEDQLFFAEANRNEVVKEPFDYITEVPRGEVIKDVTEKQEYIAFEEPPRHEERPPEQTQYSLVQTEEQPPVTSVYGINPEDIIPGIASAPERQTEVLPDRTAFIPPVSTDRHFSVRTISQLDRGQYYVQIAAHHAETVENAVMQIDQRYSPVLYKDGDNFYRILIGPLNQGESAAVLSRFKSIGYTDAFVRRGG